MEPADFNTALTELLSSAILRDAFARDRLATAKSLTKCNDDVDALIALDAQELNLQAGVLLKKRLSEVAHLLPVTFGLQSEMDCLFLQYAESHWPKGHRRHLEDAAHFCAYLVANSHPICDVEFNRIAFDLKRDRWAFHAVKNVPTRSGFRRGIQILFRTRSGIRRQFLLYLDL